MPGFIVGLWLDGSNAPAVRDVTLSNSGTAPLDIVISTLDGWITPSVSHATVLANDTYTFQISCALPGATGEYSGLVTVEVVNGGCITGGIGDGRTLEFDVFCTVTDNTVQATRWSIKENVSSGRWKVLNTLRDDPLDWGSTLALNAGNLAYPDGLIIPVYYASDAPLYFVSPTLQSSSSTINPITDAITSFTWEVFDDRIEFTMLFSDIDPLEHTWNESVTIRLDAANTDQWILINFSNANSEITPSIGTTNFYCVYQLFNPSMIIQESFAKNSGVHQLAIVTAPTPVAVKMSNETAYEGDDPVPTNTGLQAASSSGVINYNVIEGDTSISITIDTDQVTYPNSGSSYVSDHTLVTGVTIPNNDTTRSGPDYATLAFEINFVVKST